MSYPNEKKEKITCFQLPCMVQLLEISNNNFLTYSSKFIGFLLLSNPKKFDETGYRFSLSYQKKKPTTDNTKNTGTTKAKHKMMRKPHHLPFLADLQPPWTLQEARRMAELGASFCLTTTQSGHLSLKAGLPTVVLILKTDDGQKGMLKRTTKRTKDDPNKKPPGARNRLKEPKHSRHPARTHTDR